MTLRDLINEVTDNNPESNVLDYEIYGSVVEHKGNEHKLRVEEINHRTKTIKIRIYGD